MNDDELRYRWEILVKPDVFRHAHPADEPVTIFLGGQPGAGKTQGKNFALA